MSPNDYYRKQGYYSTRTAFDPVPRGGLTEHVYCGLKARYGFWPKEFLALCEKYYDGRIPPRFEQVAERMARDRDWEKGTEHMVCDGSVPTITIVDKAGRVLHRWRPTREEWEASRP